MVFFVIVILVIFSVGSVLITTDVSAYRVTFVTVFIEDIDDITVNNNGEAERIILRTYPHNDTPLKFSLHLSPSFASINIDDDGIVSVLLQPENVQIGTYRVEVSAKTSSIDNHKRFHVTVVPAGENIPPDIRHKIQDFKIQIADTARLYLNTKIVDYGGEDLTYESTVTNEAIVSTQIRGHMMDITGLSIGRTEIKVCGNDGIHEELCQIFDVRVPDDTPRIIDEIGSIDILMDQEVEIDLNDYFVDDDDLVYTVKTLSGSGYASADVRDSIATIRGLSVGYEDMEACADDNLNEEACQIFTVNVIIDTTPPIITAPPDIIKEADAVLTRVDDLGTPIFSDNADPNIIITNDKPDSFPLGNTTITWTATDTSGNSATDTQTVTIQDTTPPEFSFVPKDRTFEIKEAPIILTPSQIGIATATDAADENPTITHNATDSFEVGSTTIIWTATDSSGNSAHATQIITVAHIPLIITAPEKLALNATGILTFVDLDGLASIHGSSDSTTLKNNATSPYLPIGDTVILWNATDGMGNHVTANTTVTVTADDLDSDWDYKLIETQRYYIPYSAVSATKHPINSSLVVLRTSDVHHGVMHFFKSFPKNDIQGKTLTVDLELNSQPTTSVYLLDGSYSKTSSDFVRTSPILKGGGMLASYAHTYISGIATPSVVVNLMPDWSKSQLDHVTLFIDAHRPPHGQSLYISSVQIDDHSRWIFDDYKVRQNQNAGTGTFVLVPPSDESLVIHPLPVRDTFDGSLDGWTDWGATTDHTVKLSTAGRTSVNMEVDGFAIDSGIAKTVDISTLQDDQRLVISNDFRATSNTPHSAVTNARMLVFDADTDELLFNKALVAGGTRDTGWRTHTIDVTDHVSGSEAIRVVFYIHDGWSANHKTNNWYDDIRIYATGTGGASGAGDIDNPSWPPVTLPPANNATDATPTDAVKVPGMAERIESDSILLKWGIPFDDDGTTRYAVAITGPNGEVHANDDVAGMEYLFADLTPDTEYKITLKVSGEEHTQSVIHATTLPAR